LTDTITPPRPAAPTTARRVSSNVSRRQIILWSVGLLAVLVGALGSVAFARTANQRDRVLIAARDLPAGAEITADDVRVAQVASDDLALVSDTQLGAIVGNFTKVRVLAGQPFSLKVVQPGPLIGAGKVVVAVPVTPVQLPARLREQSLIELIVIAPVSGGAAGTDTFRTTGVVVEYPAFGPDTGANTQGALSVEVDPAAAGPITAAGRNIAVVLIDPTGADG
jgi:hypothetical protein